MPLLSLERAPASLPTISSILFTRPWTSLGFGPEVALMEPSLPSSPISWSMMILLRSTSCLMALIAFAAFSSMPWTSTTASSMFFERSSICKKVRSASRRCFSTWELMRFRAALLASSACFNSCALFTSSACRSLKPSNRFLTSCNLSLMLRCAMLVSESMSCSCLHRPSKSSCKRCWSASSDDMDLCPASRRFVVARVASWSLSKEACLSEPSQISSWARWSSVLVRIMSPSNVPMLRSWCPSLWVADSTLSCASFSS
mmetsp:Transcript_92076/g.257372  ORF Transcript_92076/g.257372 Transcript_92076/m.257372 type:complete len:259 (-) Transcript_92076:265-1041(-)